MHKAGKHFNGSSGYYIVGLFLVAGAIRELVFIDHSFLRAEFTPRSFAIFLGTYGALGIIVSAVVNQLQHRAIKFYQNRIEQLELALLRSEPLQQVGFMTAGLAHNFKNYLGVLEGTRSILERGQQANDALKRAVEMQGKCIIQATNCVDKMLSLVSEQREHDKGLRPLEEVLQEAADLSELLISHRSVTILRDFSALSRQVEVSDLALMQSILNLVKNAAEASADNSTIIITSDLLEQNDLLELSISVKDFGSGMSQDTIKGLFSPLESSKKDGNGLGLVTVKKLVESDGGRVDVRSELGKGTEVSMRFPISGAIN